MSIYQSLDFLKSKVEETIQSRYKVQPIKVSLDTLKKDSKGGVFINLLYLEEEKTLKNNEYINTFYKEGKSKNKNNIEGYKKVNPKLFFNIYVIIAAYNYDYEDSLKDIDAVIQTFQEKNVFKRTNNDLTSDFVLKKHDKLNKLIIDIQTLDFQQHTSLFQSLDIENCPYVIYKIRSISYETEAKPDMLPIQNIYYLLNQITDDFNIDNTDEKYTEDEIEEVLKIRNEIISLLDSYKHIKIFKNYFKK